MSINKFIKLTECTIQPNAEKRWALFQSAIVYVPVANITAIRRIKAFTDDQGQDIFCAQVYTMSYNFMVKEQAETVRKLCEEQL